MSLSTIVAMLAYSGPLGNAPTLTASLRASPAASTWILSSMSVGLAISLLTAGTLADNFGRRRMFVIGACVFAAGSVLCALTTGPTLYIVGRLVEGFGAAGVIATGLGLVNTAASCAAHRASVGSWWGVSMGAGIALGPVLTGLLDLGGQWRIFYWVLVASSAAIAVAGWRLFTETTRVFARRMDFVGVVTMTGCMALLLVALIETRQGLSGVTIVYGVAALVCLAAFVTTQLRGRAPMLEPALFRSSDFVASTVAALAAGTGVIALMSFVCTFLVIGMDMSTLGAGGLFALWSATGAGSALLGRRCPDRFSGAGQLVIGLSGVAIGMLLLTALNASSTPWRLVPGLLVAGMAMGILNTGLGRQAVASVSPERAALGTGTNNTARYIGSSIGVTIVTVIAAGPSGTTAELMTGWNQAAALAAGLSLVGAGVVAVLTQPRTASRTLARRLLGGRRDLGC